MLREIAERAKKIDVGQLALEVVQANSELIADNVRNQLEIGVAGDGSAVGIYSSVYYADWKQRIGSKASHGTADLKVTGRLYDEMFVKVDNKGVEVDSSVSYSKDQKDRYGKRIYEVTTSNQEQIKEINSEQAVRWYNKALGL